MTRSISGLYQDNSPTFGMNIFIVVSLVALILYVYLIGRWRYFWEETAEYVPSKTASTGISVIVAFRNELENLDFLLSSLQNQEYPAKLFEVILVDDFSDDGSDKVAKRSCESTTNFRYVVNSGTGKKSALRTGIEIASFDLIISTDADAVMQKEWLGIICSFYEEFPSGMIVGLTDIHRSGGITGEFIEAEFISLIASGAGAAAAGRPLYCNGANLAYRKSLFSGSVDPLNERADSGDDTFLLHTAKKRGETIRLLKSTKSVVKVKGPENLKDFFNQHKRWVAKSRYYTDWDTIYAALVVLVINILTAVSLLLLIRYGSWIFIFLSAVKFLVDYQLLQSFYKYFGKKIRIIKMMFFSLIYPFYFPVLLVSGFLSGYRWKGREYKPFQ
jgi:biofilm PGA synthesis N-glycosyltransferase PgaC